MSVAGGYAIEHEGAIDMTTVSQTERGAKINWLVTSCGIMLPDSMEDPLIEKIWERFSFVEGAQCVAITVRKQIQ